MPQEPPDKTVERLNAAVQAALERGRTGVRTATRGGRNAVQRYQLEAELDSFWARLGKLAYQLSESGDITHPGVDQAIERIRELEAKIAETKS